MRNHRLRRASTLAVLLVSGLQLRVSSAHAVSLEQPHSAEVRATRAACQRLLRLAELASARRGGELARARRQAETSGAKTSAAWLDWLPDFSLTIRRQLEQKTDTDTNAPRWRLDFEGQLNLSLQKLRATSTAEAAEAKAQAELERAAYSGRARALGSAFELYFSERKAQLFKDQIVTFESLSSEMAHPAAHELASDDALLAGYLGELRGMLAELELQREDSAQHLAAMLDVPVEASGFDPQLDLPVLLESIRAELEPSSPGEAQVRRTDIRLEEQRLRWAESQTWYVPEFRSTSLALLPQGNAAGTGSSFHLTSVTSELSLGFRLRPGVPALQAAQRLAVEKSRFDDEQSRRERELTEDQARARLDELSSSWSNENAVRIANAELEDTLRRYARGERSIAELASASRSSLAARLSRELILRDAVLAQLELSSNDRSELAPRGEPRREELAATEVDRRLARSLGDSALLKSARAEAGRAALRARSERSRVASTLETGVLLPVYETDDPSLLVRPELTISSSGSLATVVREASLLGRWSLDLRATGLTQRALESQARLRRLQVELAQKQQQWVVFNARLELAQARELLELSQRISQFASESRAREQRWLQQGAASERDLRAAELAHHTAVVEQGKLEARVRSAEIGLASYLGAARGTQVSVNETPETLERWAGEHFFPDNHLFGFESAGRRREAELAVESAHALTESLAKPPHSATFTTQATQGLRGGAFSLTLALSVALDSPRDAPQVTRAAEREGEARGRLASLERELAEQRARERQRFDEANALLQAELAIQQRLKVIADAVRSKQAATPDMHAALKQRQQAALQAAWLQSERRRLEAEEQRRAAAFRGFALGNPTSTAREASKRAGKLEEAVHALTEERSDVAIADAAAEGARAHQPVPVASALHLVGPFAIGSYAANRVVGPATTKVWRGDVGVGLALGLDESVAFIASHQLSNAAELQRSAAREDAALQAIHELGRTWTARALERASAQEETEARHYLQGSAEPRFGLGQITAATLVEAEQQHAFARLLHASDESRLRTQHALLSALGATVSDATLDEYERGAAAWLATNPATQKKGGPAPDSAELAARARSAAASSAITAGALRVASPITGLVEFRPARVATTTGTDDTRETSTSHELLWVLSLIVPFKPKEFGAVSLAAAQARESDEELAAASRKARLRWLDLQSRVIALEKDRASAAARREGSERALAELDRRLRAAQDQTTIDEVATARRTLSEARRAEIVAQGKLLEAGLLFRAIQENR